MRSSPDSARRFVFILAEAELEQVPKEIASQKAVFANASTRGKKASNILLDASFHHSAMTNLEDGGRRGRPDISHFFLLLCLDSRLNHDGLLKIVIHTRNDERIDVRPDLRLPPSYHRFVGLMESLFQNGAVPSLKDPLLKIECGWPLADVLKAEKCETIIVLDAEGLKSDPVEVLSEGKGATAIIIGGFPSGQLHSDLSSLKVEKLSLGEEMLKVWTVTAEMLCAAQKSLKGP
jgi:rRNA small subunit pseudouridine methyltransferase Nep1